MKKRSMKIVSLILAVIMAISIMPLAALADDLGPKRKVGVVVYGSELTYVLTEIEDTLQGNLSLQDTVDMLEELSTKVVDGTGFSVPEVDVTLTSQSGQVTKFVEDPNIEIFTETTEIYVPFQNEVERQLLKIEEDIDGLEAALRAQSALTATMVDTIETLREKIEELVEKFETIAHDIVTGLAKATGLNGALYRTYVTEDAVLVNKDYTVHLNGFIDTDEDGNAVTRDGYILYNDGLTKDEGGSGFNTERTFDITVQEQGKFDHDIQFVGPANGIQGKIELPSGIATVYDTAVTTLNTLNKGVEDLKDGLLASKSENDSWFESIAKDLRDTLAKIANVDELINWLRTWNAPTMATTDQLDLSYKFLFPGLWCAESDAGFRFKNVDLAENGIAQSTFVLANRTEIVDILKFMKDLGADTFKGAIKATFGGEVAYSDGTVMTYEGITDLYKQLIAIEDGQINLSEENAFAIVKTYMGVIADLNLLDRVVDTSNLIPQLKLHIPAILKTTSDEEGMVTFTKDSNVTLTWMLEIIPTITDKLAEMDTGSDLIDLMLKLTNYAAQMTAKFGEAAINKLVYPFAQRLGFVGPKLASGEYIMFQIAAGDGYWVNPLAYTMTLSWDNDEWAYTTVSSVGILTPYFAEGLYDFVRNTTFAGTIDKVLGKLTGKEDYSLISDILNDKVDLNDEMNRIAMGAVTAFASEMSFDALGLDKLYSSKTELVTGINEYLKENGRTAQNLMVYLNKQALKAKSVYAGNVDENWYFYNFDKSPTATITKLIQKSTDNIAACFVNTKQSEAVSKTGSAISQTVNKVGTAVETAVKNVASKVASTVGATVKSAAQSVVKSAVSAVKNIASNLFSKLFKK